MEQKLPFCKRYLQGSSPFIGLSDSLYQEEKVDSKSLENLINTEDTNLNLCYQSYPCLLLCLITSHNWPPSHRLHIFFSLQLELWSWYLRWCLRQPGKLLSFPRSLPRLQEAYMLTSVFPVNPLLHGCLEQKPRRLEGKLVFPPLYHCSHSIQTRAWPKHTQDWGHADKRVMGVRRQTTELWAGDRDQLPRDTQALTRVRMWPC